MQQLSSSNQLVPNGMWSPLPQFCTRLFPTLSAWPYEIIVFLFKQRQSAEIFPRDPPLSPWLRVRISCHTRTSKMTQLASLATQASRGMLSGYTTPGLKNPRLTNCRVHTLTPPSTRAHAYHPHPATARIHTQNTSQRTHNTSTHTYVYAHTPRAHSQAKAHNRFTNTHTHTLPYFHTSLHQHIHGQSHTQLFTQHTQQVSKHRIQIHTHTHTHGDLSRRTHNALSQSHTSTHLTTHSWGHATFGDVLDEIQGSGRRTPKTPSHGYVGTETFFCVLTDAYAPRSGISPLEGVV